MIYESEPWRKKLKTIEGNLRKSNTVKNFKKDYDKTYSKIECNIFLAAFSIRKMIDSKCKVMDQLRDYRFKAIKFIPIRKIDYFHRWPLDNCYDFANGHIEILNERKVCNFLIHSYVFWLDYDKKGIVQGFIVSSDRYRNKLAYYISWKEFLNFIHLGGYSEITTSSCHYDKRKKDYIFENI